MQPDYTYLIEKTGIDKPLMGFYDTTDPEAFQPFQTTGTCIFAYYKKLIKGISVLLTQEQYGCGGAGKWLCNVQTRSEDDYVEFLADEEGLKADHELMRKWLKQAPTYKQEHKHLVYGPLRADQYEYLKTISFFVNPDQLSMLMIGAQYYATPDDPEPVLAPFGSGCMQLASLFQDLDIAQAIVGGTDMAMRRFLPPDMMIFTVTKPMFEQLCRLDKDSFLERSFITRLKRARR